MFFGKNIILKPFWQYPIFIAFSIVTWTVVQAAQLFIPYALGQVFNLFSDQSLDQGLQNIISRIALLAQLSETKFIDLGIIIGLIFIITIIIIPIPLGLGAWIPYEISCRLHYDLYRQTLNKILTVPLSFYEKNNPGALASMVTKGIENYALTYEEFFEEIMPQLIRIAGVFIIINWVEWKIALFFLLSFVIIVIYSYRITTNIIELEDLVESHEYKTESYTSEIITNIKTVKAFVSEKRELKRQLQRRKREFKVNSRRLNLAYTKLYIWQNTAINFSFFLILILIIFPTAKGTVSVGHFITTVTIARMAYEEVEPINYFAQMLTRRYSSMKRLSQFLQYEEGQDAVNLTTSSSKLTPYQFQGKLEFRNVSFSYDPETSLLKNINLQIKPYETVALVGRSGAGKSTLIKLILRYFQPLSGQILIDDQNISELDIALYRQSLAIVHQDVEIFNGTIRDNLIYGNPQVSFEELQEACRIAQLTEFIQQLPHGFATKLGERGVRLSGGQKQRLGIARALLVKPEILILDEATSSLDYESERLIQLAMNSIKGTRTMLIIAHRLSTVREADKIMVMDRGRIVEIGTHQELLLQKGMYHRLHSLQETGNLV